MYKNCTETVASGGMRRIQGIASDKPSYVLNTCIELVMNNSFMSYNIRRRGGTFNATNATWVKRDNWLLFGVYAGKGELSRLGHRGSSPQF